MSRPSSSRNLPADEMFSGNGNLLIILSLLSSPLEKTPVDSSLQGKICKARFQANPGAAHPKRQPNYSNNNAQGLSKLVLYICNYRGEEGGKGEEQTLVQSSVLRLSGVGLN